MLQIDLAEMKRNLTVAEIDHRRVVRDSVFVMADLRITGKAGDHRVRVRNLSGYGMMAEGNVRVTAGAVVEVNLRGVGWVSGRVAWIVDGRFGIGFDDMVDAQLVRSGVDSGSPTSAPRYLRMPVIPTDPRSLRKI